MSWDEADKELKSGGGFYKLEDGSNKLRILSEPVVRKTHWKANKPFDCAGDGCGLCQDADEKVSRIVKRFAFYIIDRKTGEQKVAEVPPSVAKKIREYQVEDGGEYAYPGPVAPYDVNVKKSGSGLGTEYDVVPSRKNEPLTPDEDARLVKAKPLADVLKAAADKAKEEPEDPSDVESPI